MDGTNLTILVALAAGVISFLSPCVLPLVPAYLGQLTAIAVAGAAPGARPSRWLAVRHALAYVAGFGAVFTVLGITATFAAGPLVDYLPALRTIGGIVLIVLGLDLAGLLDIPVLSRTWRPLDAGAAGSLATATGTTAFGSGAAHADRRRPDRRPRRELARRLVRVVRTRGDLRHRLEPVHRHHPGRHPDDGRDLDDDRPGRRPARRLHDRPRASRSWSSPPSSTARRA